MSAAESGAQIGVQFGEPQTAAPHATVKPDELPNTDLIPDLLFPSVNIRAHIDLSPGSPAYESLKANGVVSSDLSLSIAVEPGPVRVPRVFTENEVRTVFGRPSMEEDRKK